MFDSINSSQNENGIFLNSFHLCRKFKHRTHILHDFINKRFIHRIDYYQAFQLEIRTKQLNEMTEIIFN